jgi:transcriptional regulator with XRE-family HTH domain
VYVPVVTLKQLRQGQGFTVARAAQELGLSERHLYRLESGHGPLSRTVALAMSAVYGVPVDKVEAAGKEGAK